MLLLKTQSNGKIFEIDKELGSYSIKYGIHCLGLQFPNDDFIQAEQTEMNIKGLFPN